MKKFVSGVLTGAILTSSLALAATYVAEDVSFKIFVNGQEFTSAPALAINGSTYLPLRAVGDVLGIPVNWNSELNQVEVGTMPTSFDKYEVENYIVGTVWNEGFWFLREYVEGGLEEYYMSDYISVFADSADEKVDVNKITKKILDTKSTIEAYNNEFNGNDKWDAFYKEYNRLYALVESNSFNKDNYDTTFFVKVRDEFCESLNK